MNVSWGHRAHFPVGETDSNGESHKHFTDPSCLEGQQERRVLL